MHLGRTPRAVVVLAITCTMLASCSTSPAEDAPATGSGTDAPGTEAPAADRDQMVVTLLTHDSFNLSDEVLAAFTEQTGLTVEVLRAGDAGAVLSQAILTKDAPLADAIFGIDNVNLARALDAGILAAHPTTLPDDVDPAVVLDPELRAVPIDRGDVCLNYDRAAFSENSLALPETIEQLAAPEYASRLVVQDPSTSSPGVAFLLATIAALGEDEWQDWWADLRTGGVTITAGWEDAYYGHFSGGSGEGDKPLVVSYASSPAAEVLFGPDPEAEQAPTGVILDSCFSQIEFAGTLVNADNPEGASRLVDFLLSDLAQRDIPLQMFVFPVRDVSLPDVFVRHARVPTDVLTLPTDLIAQNRDDWVEAWVDLMLR